MANGTKEYKIVINGLTESIDAVKSLNEQLNGLEAKINALGSKAVNVDLPSTKDSSIKENIELQKELNRLKKEEAAENRLAADEYANTLKGMKQELADIKAVMQNVDLGDTDKMDKLVRRANELNGALKKVEESYGQFGRNVGNYKSAADGFKNFAIEVNGVTKEFNTAKQALKELKAERDTLSAKKDMGLISEEEAKRLQGLIPIVAQLQSSIQDAGKPMDALLDTMQSFVALTQVEKGLSAFFGLEGTGVEETLKNLVALQNAMQGLQNIQKQLQSEEGLGKYFSKSSEAIDNFTNKLFGVKKTSEEVATAEKAQAAATETVAGASNKAATAENAQSAANVAVATTSKAATVAAKGLGLALKAIGIGIALELISWLVEGVKSAATAIVDLFRVSEQEQKQFEMSIGAVTDSTKELIEVLNQSVNAGYITKEQALTEQFHLQAEEIKNVRDEMVKLVKLRGDLNGSKLSESQYGFKGVGWFSQIFRTKSDVNYNNELKTFYEFLDKVQEASEKADKAYSDFTNGLPNSEKNLKSAQETVKALWLELQKDDVLKKVQKNLETFFPDESFRQGANAIINTLKALNTQFGNFDKTLKDSQESLRRYLMSDLEKQIDDINKEEQEQLKAAGNRMDLQTQVMAKAEEKRKKAREAANKSNISSIKKHSKEVENADRNLIQLELRLMNEGLNKKLRQLDEEERQTLNKLKQNSRTTAAEIEKIQNAYSTLREREISSYLKNLEKNIKESAENIQNIQFKLNTDAIENQIEELRNKFDELSNTTDLKPNEIAAKSDIRTYTQRGYTFREASERFGGYQTRLSEFPNTPDVLKSSIDERFKLLEKYYNDVVKLQQENIKKQGELEKQKIESQIEQEKQAENKRYNIQFEGLQKERDNLDEQIELYEKRKNKDEETLKQMKGNRDEYDKQTQQALDQHMKIMQQITEEGNNAIKKNELDTQQEIYSIQEQYHNLQLDSLRDVQSKVNEILSRQPVRNNWGIVNLKETKKQLDEAKKGVETTLQYIKAKKKEIGDLFSNGILNMSAYTAVLNQLGNMENSFGQMFDSIIDQSKQRIPQFVQSLQVYLNGVFDAYNQVMQAVWNYQEEGFDDEQEQLDKALDIIEDKLSKQEELLEEHKSKVDSIEDELATSRGDRRQHLIDQLNAEMEAERAAAKEKKRLDKEKEAAERKQDELDRKRRKAQYHRDVLQAIVNGAMSVTYASMNTWPLPAIPLMSMAAAATAAQLAIMASNKPYRVGGQLDGGLVTGKRHTQGGVPVGNTGIEVEGSEYIIRRESTTPNLNLLDFINKSQKKLDLSDFVEFYSDKPRKVIKNINKKMYADGGYLPALPSQLDIKDQLRDIYIMQDQRPVWVSVVDINNKQADVRRVQTLAGLSE